VRGTADVFEVATGPSGLGWRLVRWLYRRGASPGLLSRLYATLRRSNDYNADSFGLRLLGRSLRAQYRDPQLPLVVSHPILVGVFRNRPALIYQHGELIAPPESVVRGAEVVIVPTESCAEPFLRAGYSRDSVLVSGLCIEPALVKQADSAIELRRSRISSPGLLTGAFYSSGAEPSEHVESIVIAALAHVTGGGRAVIVAERGRRLASLAVRSFARAGVGLTRISSSDMIPADLPAALLVEFASRREETTLTARLFPSYDFLVSPAHERSNWGVGLGLPVFILEPCIGPFAPLNRQLLLEHGVAFDLTGAEQTASFADRLATLRNRGKLLEMVERGWGRYPIDGFSRIGDFLFARFGA
jgi:hypothetical protein